MKVAIIGSGNVGRTVFSDLQHASMIREITLVGRNREKLRAEVEDAKDAAVLHEGHVPKLTFEAGKDADFLVFDNDLLTAEQEGFSHNIPSDVYICGKKVK